MSSEEQPVLYVDPVRLDPAQHRHHRIGELVDLSVARRMHLAYLTAVEFAEAALDFPILFAPTGERDGLGRAVVVPVALLGLEPNENLHVDGGQWQARYVPAFIRRYPFLSAPVAGQAAPGVFVDAAWSGFSATSGEGAALFEADDRAAPALVDAMQFLERFEAESVRTQAFCERVVDLGVLRQMKVADAALPPEHGFAVDGYFVVDEDKLQALPDAFVVELHRKGLLMLLQIHLLSLANMRHLVARKSLRAEAASASS